MCSVSQSAFLSAHDGYVGGEIIANRVRATSCCGNLKTTRPPITSWSVFISTYAICIHNKVYLCQPRRYMRNVSEMDGVMLHHSKA